MAGNDQIDRIKLFPGGFSSSGKGTSLIMEEAW